MGSSMVTMARKSAGELEMMVLKHLWEVGSATVLEVQRQVGSAYTTILTVLQRLHKKGQVKRYREGRTHIYSASGTSIIKRLFRKKPTILIRHLLEEDLTADDIAAMENLIKEAKERLS